MAKFLKWTLFIVAGLAVVLFLAFQVLKSQTKKHSPEERLTYQEAGNELSVFYNRPYKKGRKIFGELVPYGEVWRTGANEPTTFSVKKKIEFGGKELPPGNYTLWTIPQQDSWTVIVNAKHYGWGVNMNGVASREPDADVLQVVVPVKETMQETEQFTIAFAGSGAHPELVFKWDVVEVSVPMSW